MHRHDALRRKNEIQQAEHRLFHLAGIGRTADQNDFALEIHRNHRFAAGSVTFGVGAKARQVDDRVLGRETGQLVGLGAHEQGADKQIVPRKLVDHAHPQAVLGLRAAVEVGHEQQVLVAEREQEVVVQPVERLRVHRLVGLAPPHGAFARPCS